MGARCTTPKITRYSRKMCPYPIITPKDITSPNNHISNDKTQTVTPDSGKNSGSTSIFSFKCKSTRSDLDYEESSRRRHTVCLSDPNSIPSPILDDVDSNRPLQYKKGPLVEKGFCGAVYECLHLESGELLAAKSVTVEQNYIEGLRREIMMYKGLSHPNIVRYYALEVSQPTPDSNLTIDIILEYVSGGSIRKLLERFQKLDERVVSAYTKQIIEGLAYLHKNEIIHRNLKSSNVLIDASGTVKLSDFGCVRNLDKFMENFNSMSLSYWAAPEVAAKKCQGSRSDIWTVGCIVVEMLTGPSKQTINSEKADYFYKTLESESYNVFLSQCSEKCRDFLQKTLSLRMDQRPTASQLLDHPFLQDGETMQSMIMMKPQETTQDNIFVEQKKHEEEKMMNKGEEFNTQGRMSHRKNHPKLSIHTDSSKLIPNRLNRLTPSPIGGLNYEFTSTENIPHSARQDAHNSDKEYLTPDVVHMNKDGITPRRIRRRLTSNNSNLSKDGQSSGKRTCLSPVYFPNNPLSIANNDSSIKNTFFSDVRGPQSGSGRSKFYVESKEDLNRSGEGLNTFNENDTICFNTKRLGLGEKLLKEKDSNCFSPDAEEKRREFERKMLEEMQEINISQGFMPLDDENTHPDMQSPSRRVKGVSESQKKLELRKKFEMDMEKELLMMNSSTLKDHINS